jgi:hypothetical protein
MSPSRRTKSRGSSRLRLPKHTAGKRETEERARVSNGSPAHDKACVLAACVCAPRFRAHRELPCAFAVMHCAMTSNTAGENTYLKRAEETRKSEKRGRTSAWQPRGRARCAHRRVCVGVCVLWRCGATHTPVLTISDTYLHTHTHKCTTARVSAPPHAPTHALTHTSHTQGSTHARKRARMSQRERTSRVAPCSAAARA